MKTPPARVRRGWAGSVICRDCALLHALKQRTRDVAVDSAARGNRTARNEKPRLGHRRGNAGTRTQPSDVITQTLKLPYAVRAGAQRRDTLTQHSVVCAQLGASQWLP
jgi:hypothetical protein